MQFNSINSQIRHILYLYINLKTIFLNYLLGAGQQDCPPRPWSLARLALLTQSHTSRRTSSSCGGRER